MSHGMFQMPVATFGILGMRVNLDVFADPQAIPFLEQFDGLEVNSVRIIQVSVGITAGDDVRTESLCFFNRIDGDVARAGHHDAAVFEAKALRSQHLLYEVDAP